MSGRRFATQGYKARKKKRDDNELEIVQALEAVPGVMVVPLDKPVDLLCGYAGKTYLLEVKNPDGANRIETAQQEFFDAWPGSPVIVVRNVAEAMAALGIGTTPLSIMRVSR